MVDADELGAAERTPKIVVRFSSNEQRLLLGLVLIFE